MRKRGAAAVIVMLAATLTLTGCKSDPACWFAEDTIGCLVVTDNQNREVP